MSLIEAAQQALEALELYQSKSSVQMFDDAVKALRQAQQTEQEPVAWMFVNEDGECEQIEYGPVFDDPGVTPLYTAPPKREWVGLHGSEVPEPYKYDVMFNEGWWWAEEKLKEKNHG
jgi:hypothetical protein